MRVYYHNGRQSCFLVVVVVIWLFLYGEDYAEGFAPLVVHTPRMNKSSHTRKLRESSSSSSSNIASSRSSTVSVAAGHQHHRGCGGGPRCHVLTASSTTTTLNSSSSGSDSVGLDVKTKGDDDDNNNLVRASIAVGVASGLVGYLYGVALSWSQKTLWKSLPTALLGSSSSIIINPLWFVTGMCTLGGLVVGVLSTVLDLRFTVSDFVSALAAVPNEAARLPKSRTSLFPLLLLSLLTSAFGFSAGPEAPMVCAGGLVGASVARWRWFRRGSGEDDHDDNNDTSHDTEALAYAGAAGSLTAFMGIPLAGSVFALEMTRKSSDLAGEGKLLSPAVLASGAALFLLRVVLLPHAPVGGHFEYGAMGEALTGRALMGTAMLAGVLGAGLGTIFHKSVAFLKPLLWNIGKKTTGSTTNNNNKSFVIPRNVWVKTLVGVLVGLLSTYYPQTLFWGEGSLQCVVDAQRTPFAMTKHGHGLPALLTAKALVDPSVPYYDHAWSALQIGSAKLLAIVLAAAAKFPGGIIFPLFFAGAPFAHAVGAFFSIQNVRPILVVGTMAATQASVTKTPLATALILSLLASPTTTQLSLFLPACLVASYTAVYAAQIMSKKSYFSYADKNE